MRIVSGEFKGRGLFSPKGRETRPTSDRARQAVFNILEHAPWAGGDCVVGALVLDVFAGTGALGLEALSRGAEDALFIEQNAAALDCCRRNIAAFGLEDRAQVLKIDATRLPQRPAKTPPRTLVFLDPPYDKGLGALCLTLLQKKNWLAPGAFCVFETSSRAPEAVPPGYETLDTRDYGAARVLFLRAGAVTD